MRKTGQVRTYYLQLLFLFIAKQDGKGKVVCSQAHIILTPINASSNLNPATESSNFPCVNTYHSVAISFTSVFMYVIGFR